jgi:hypothetical protein
MDDHDGGTAPATEPFSPDPSGGFERGVDDRRRLEYQFGLLREDFNSWFDGMSMPSNWPRTRWGRSGPLA